MNIHEHQAKQILKKYGAVVPEGIFGLTVDEVVEKANNQLAGLAAYVCTGSIELANKTSESLETGMVAINTPFLSNAETPFGGIKQSGYGREGGSVGIKDYLNIKYTHLGLSG